MKIGVISDTHDQRENILKATKILNNEGVELTIHCGDWVSPFTTAFYKDLKSPIKGVFGNNDGDRFLHPVVAKMNNTNIEYYERVIKLEIDGRKIFVYHGDYEDVTDALVTCGKFDAVFHGHTHQAVNKTVGETLSLNPGTMMDYTAESVQGASFAIYDTTSNTANLTKL